MENIIHATDQADVKTQRVNTELMAQAKHEEIELKSLLEKARQLIGGQINL